MAELNLIEAADAFTHVAVRGRLDAAGVGEVELKLTSQIVAGGKSAVIDLSETTFIASLGIGMLVGIAKSMKDHGIALVVLVGRTQVRDMLELTTVDAIIPLAATREEALAKLAGS